MPNLQMPGVISLFVVLVGVAGAQEVTSRAPKLQPSVDASVLYVATAQELLRSFAVDSAAEIELPAAPTDLAAFVASSEAWRVVVAKANGERTTFAQAARLPSCDFGPGSDAFDCGYDAHQLTLWKLAELTAAHGMQAIVDRQPTAAAEDAFTLLRHARHLASQPSKIAGALAGQSEVYGLRLLQGLLQAEPKPGAKVLQRVVVELAEHTGKRAGRRGARACILAEQQRYLNATIGAAKAMPVGADADDAEAKLLREFGARLTAHVLDHSSAWLAVLDSEGDFDLPAALAGQAQRKAELRRGTNPAQLRKKLPEMAPEEAVAELARVFATMMLSDVDEVLKFDHQAIALLAACRAQVGLDGKDAAGGR